MPIIASLLGGAGCNNGCNAGVCSENTPVSRYELGQESKIAELQSQLALRDANTYNDQKLLEVYKFIDGELKNIRSELCSQAVTNADKPEIWAALAHDFLDDPDAQPDKVGRYWRDIVKH